MVYSDYSYSHPKRKESFFTSPIADIARIIANKPATGNGMMFVITVQSISVNQLPILWISWTT